MEIMQIIGLGIVVTILILVIRQQRPEFALLLSLGLSVMIFLLVAGKISLILDLFNDLANRANVNQLYLNTVLKIIGIAYISEFGAQICRDAGESAVAGKIELAGKILILVLAVPIIAVVLDTIAKLLP
ncbi:MAG TPA: stage III sporulation protein AD [Negativicutes bacterium]|nr:stage III sporulation protein AD [Negativicutes bacterium]